MPEAAGSDRTTRSGTGPGTGAGTGGRVGPPPAPVRRPPSLLGIAMVATAALVAAWVTIGIFLPAIGELGRAGQDPAALPRTLELCGRTWERAGLDGMTADEAFARDDLAPIVVTEAGAGVCPPGACSATSPDEGCATAVYVKRGEDDFVRYELVAYESEDSA